MPQPGDPDYEDPLPSRLVGVCNVHPSIAPDVMGRLLGEFPDGWALIDQHISSSEDFSRYDIQQALHRFQEEFDPQCEVEYSWVGLIDMEAMLANYPAADRSEVVRPVVIQQLREEHDH